MITIDGIELPFTAVQRGASVWPSNDPAGPAYDDYFCDRCGNFVMRWDICGSWFIPPGMTSGEFHYKRIKERNDRLIWHYENCSKFNTKNKSAVGERK